MVVIKTVFARNDLFFMEISKILIGLLKFHLFYVEIIIVLISIRSKFFLRRIKFDNDI